MTTLPGYNPTIDTNVLIRHIVEHTHAVVGREYFRLLVKHLAEALQVSGVDRKTSFRL